MDIPIRPIGCWLSVPTIRTSTVVVSIRQTIYDFGQDDLVNVSCREVGFAEVHLGRIGIIIELQLERLGDLIVLVISGCVNRMSGYWLRVQTEQNLPQMTSEG